MTPYSVWPWCLLHQCSIRVPPLWWIQNEIVTWCLASGNKQDFINTSTTGRKNGHLWWTKGRREDLHLWCSDRLDSPPAWNSRAAEQPSKTLSAKPPVKGAKWEPHNVQSRLGQRHKAQAESSASAEWFKLTGCRLQVNYSSSAGEELSLQYLDALGVKGGRAWSVQCRKIIYWRFYVGERQRKISVSWVPRMGLISPNLNYLSGRCLQLN